MKNNKKVQRIIILIIIIIIAGGIYLYQSGMMAKKYTFKAEVTDISEHSIMVKVNEDEFLSSDMISVSIDEKFKDDLIGLKVGDTVKICYDGYMLTSYPAMIKEIFSISIDNK